MSKISHIRSAQKRKRKKKKKKKERKKEKKKKKKVTKSQLKSDSRPATHAMLYILTYSAINSQNPGSPAGVEV